MSVTYKCAILIDIVVFRGPLCKFCIDILCYTIRFWIRNKFANAQISVIQFVTSLERLWAEYAVCAFPAVDLQKNVHKNSAAKYHHKKISEKICKV